MVMCDASARFLLGFAGGVGERGEGWEEDREVRMEESCVRIAPRRRGK